MIVTKNGITRPQPKRRDIDHTTKHNTNEITKQSQSKNTIKYNIYENTKYRKQYIIIRMYHDTTKKHHI